MLYDAGLMVLGVDICEEAIDKARACYPGPVYVQRDIADLKIPVTFDAIVSFETLEHLPDPAEALNIFARGLPHDGLLIASVPNEERYPFNPDVFANDVYPHLCHYTPEEFDALLKANGFMVESRWCQIGKRSDVTPGTDGMFLVYVSRRR